MAKSFKEIRKFSMLLIIFMLVNLVSSDIAKDKEECANQLVGLATCLSYVSGQAKAPTLDCCTGLNQVLKDSLKCLCVLVKDRNDPGLGFTINATLALGLPKLCKAPSASEAASKCPGLLHLAPNSPDAKVFNDFAKAISAAPSNSTTPTSSSSSKPTGSSGTSSAKDTSDGGKSSRCMLTGTVYGVLLWSFASLI